jgi:two-component system nitrogen regulation sensor histidine kinase GlnL
MRPHHRAPAVPATLILEHITLGTLLFRADWCVAALNPMAEMMLAISARHAVGQPFSDQIRFDGQPLVPLLQRVVQQGQVVRQRRVTLTLADRTQLTVDYLVQPLEAADYPVLLELQQVDRQLRISRETHLLHQQLASRDLVRGLAHEIKNPLGGLRGAAQLLAAETPAHRDYTDIIIREADRLQALVDRMLGPHRPEQRTAINIHAILEHVRNLALAGADPGLKIVRDYDPSIPELTGVADQLIQVVLNIVTNAAHVLQGQGRITLRTRILRHYTLRQRCHRLVLQLNIIDNGPGIAPELADTLFLPMVTSGQGSGLGLSIAQTLISQHGGLIECQSEPGHTVFSILLPLASHTT